MTAALLYWLTFVVVAAAFAQGARLYLRTLRWNERALRIVEDGYRRVAEDFYWQRYGAKEAVFALELHLARRMDDALTVLWAEDQVEAPPVLTLVEVQA